MKGQFKNLVIGERKGAAIWVKRKLKEARKKKKNMNCLKPMYMCCIPCKDFYVMKAT